MRKTAIKVTGIAEPNRMSSEIELWGGVECTVNRIGDATFDQTLLSGHQERISDLDRIASLGIRTLRYPAIWERIERNGVCDWEWQDARIGRLQKLGIDPVLTLLHHGSGPMETDLLDPTLPERLAQFAGRVAQRYSWVTWFTPVNEPVTTARFSALYGHWYPHLQDAGAFFRAVWHECRAIQLSMRAIRQQTPNAVCLLTDDYGRTSSTPLLWYQADFENMRRWIGLDLLFGQVTREHPLWTSLIDAGISPRSLQEMAADPLENAVIGIDYYLTSERFLDHRRERYSAWTHGGNGRDLYADVEAVRVLVEGIDGVDDLLAEIWRRYQRPVAITEAFLGAPRHDQVRWLEMLWNGAHAARANGVPVQAVVCWALLGSCEWDSLVTHQRGTYEPGAFDLSKPDLPETDLAAWIRMTIAGAQPLPAAPGWWETDARLIYPPVSVAGCLTGQLA
jgi:dTDP-4-dehydrorhamnose reductase